MNGTRFWVISGLIFLSAGSAQADLHSQRDFYRQGQWDRFFAGAVALRNSDKGISPSQDAELTLEVLGLIRHCQFQKAEKLVNWLKQATLNFKNYPSLQKVEKILALISGMGVEPGLEKNQVVRPAPVFTDESHWKVPASEVSKLKEAQNFRVHLENICEKSVATDAARSGS